MVTRMSGIYPLREAENMANMLIQHCFGLSRAMQQLQIDKRLSKREIQILDMAVSRLLLAEPIQYVLGSTEFYGLELEVAPEVLIPRTETEELVDIIIRDNRNEDIDILDVGTGSGCIALALKNTFSHSHVTAIDISEEALMLARRNAKSHNLAVEFKQCNILDTTLCLNVLKRKFHIIVSNPPYVLQKEKEQMADNVLRYEPHMALFVEDNDPQLFYRKIMHFARRSLKPGGKLYFEINENYADETASLFDRDTFDMPEILTDFRGKNRFLMVRIHSSFAGSCS